MITCARFVLMPDGKRVLQLYSTEWWTPTTIDFSVLSQSAKLEILSKLEHVDKELE
jgi:hypothetical protein